MSAIEMLQSAEFVVDAHGNKRAVLLDYKCQHQAVTPQKAPAGAGSVRAG